MKIARRGRVHLFSHVDKLISWDSESLHVTFVKQ